MIRVKIFDIKSVKKHESLRLDQLLTNQNPAANFDQNLPPNNSIQSQNQTLNLADFTADSAIYTRATKQLSVDFAPIKKQKNQIFLRRSASEKPNPLTKASLRIMQFAFCGALVVFSINILNVFPHANFLKNTLITSASQGYHQFSQALDQVKNSDVNQAQNSFQQAQQDFSFALDNLSFLQSQVNSNYLKEKNTDSVQNLFKSAQHLSNAGNLFAKTIESMDQLPIIFIRENQNFAQISESNLERASDQENSPIAKTSITDQLKSNLEIYQQAITELRLAKTNLDGFQTFLIPADLQQKIQEAQKMLDNLLNFVNQNEKNIPVLLKLLGDRYPHRYLILLQNDAESRPTGGFIGSLIIADINDGKITKFDFHDVYQFDGQLHENIPAPEDIASITDEWRLRDSNYSPNFDLSAEKAAWFLQKSKGPSVDTVIAINQSLLTDLLKEIGEIEVEGLKQPLNEENFQLILSYLIESKTYGATNPKQILGSTIQAFQQKLIGKNDWNGILFQLFKGTKDKKILFYSRHQDIQQLFDQLALTPRQKQIQDQEDYLQIIATSIGGNKSDYYIDQNLIHDSFINPQGEIFNELTISRTHRWENDVLLAWESELKRFGYTEISETVKDILGRGINKSSIKVYLPAGSELVNTQGVDLENIKVRFDNELQKTYFLFTMETAPSSTNTILIRYKLPYQLSLAPADIYRFSIQKQPGINNTHLTKNIYFSAALSSLKTYPENFEKVSPTQLKTETDLNKDQYFSAIINN